MVRRLLIVTAVSLLVLGGCGDDDDDSSGSASGGETAEAPDEESGELTAPDEDTGQEEAAEGATAGGGEESAAAVGAATATVTLDNGETFEFGLLCMLESQEAAGEEILFTATSYDDPHNLDITQFDADSFGGAANITITDSTTYDVVWEANSTYGTAVELTLEGNTISGSGDFYENGDLAATAVPGQLEATC